MNNQISRKSEKRPLAFLHVFKTGGTTVCDWLDTHYTPDERFICENPRHFQKKAQAETQARALYLPHPVIRGHFFLGDGLEYGRLLHNFPRLFFTVVRVPEAQFMSSLWHRVSRTHNLIVGRDYRALELSTHRDELVAEANILHHKNIGMQTGFFVCVPPVRVPPARHFWWWHHKRGLVAQAERVARRALEGIYVVGLSERLADTLRVLSWHMEWPAPRNVVNARVSGAGEQPMDNEIRAILWRHLLFDQALYAEAKRRFMRDYERLCAAAGSAAHIDEFLDDKAKKELASTEDIHRIEMSTSVGSVTLSDSNVIPTLLPQFQPSSFIELRSVFSAPQCVGRQVRSFEE